MKFSFLNDNLQEFNKVITMKEIFFIFLALTTTQLAQAEQNNCNSLNKIAEAKGAIYAPVLGKTVIKPGRLYFHSAPHSSCKLKETFIIKGDHVVVYQHYKNYDYAMFINNRTGITTQGWILESALKTTGTMGGHF